MSSSARLDVTCTPDSVRFAVLDGERPLPTTAWAASAIAAANGRPARIGSLLRVVEDELADEVEGVCIEVPHSALAGLQDVELRALGLPPRAALSLELHAKGTIDDPAFRLGFTLRHPDGRPLAHYEREGSFIQIGGSSAILDATLLAALDGIEAFNATPPEDMDRRLLAWARIRDLLPSDTGQDGYLDGLRIFHPSCITIRPYRNSQGEPDFDPVLCVTETNEELEGTETESREMHEVLPQASVERFAKSFRRLSSVRSRYPVDGGWMVVIPPYVQKALEATKRAQSGSVETRRAFISNPRAFIREAVGPEVDEEVLESLFREEGYAERVKAVGIWQKKVLPWIGKTPAQWVPPETVGLRIGDESITLEPVQIPPLEARLVAALDANEPQIEFESHDIPATPETLEAVRFIKDALERYPDRAPGDAEDSADVEPVPEGEEPVRLALLVKDNLDEVEYQPRTRRLKEAGDRHPSTLGTQLLPHQVEGLHWLQDHWCAGNPGTLLADDMGLGKTLTALSFLSWLRDQQNGGKTSPKPMLIVAPTGLLKNWQDEHDRHLRGPRLGLPVRAFGPGISDLRVGCGEDGDGGLPLLNIGRLQNSDWVLTTFETLRDYQISFGLVQWACVVLDEAQKVKNPAAAVTDAIKAMNSDFTIAMTGTPVENRLADLWSIVDTAWPGRLGALKSFVSEYEQNGTEERIAELKVTLTERPAPALMKRRMKEDHLKGLPEKNILVERIFMPEVQAQAYADFVERARHGTKKGQMLESLHHLRRVSLHPMALDAAAADADWIESSARLQGAFRLLNRIHAEGEKALIFVEFLDAQAMLAELIQRRYRLRRPPMLINGSISGEKRKARVDEFQSGRGFDVMILSPKAGGVGLTLTAANHVIHLSRWWNPAVEDQCNDRVYRIGQEQPVFVHHVLAIHPRYGEHSFDVTLHELLERKRQLSRSVLAPPSMTDADTSELFRTTVGQK